MLWATTSIKGHEFHNILYWNNIKPVGKNFYRRYFMNDASSVTPHPLITPCSMFSHVISVNMHVYKSINRASGTNLPEGWLGQRRSMSLEQSWRYPLAWVDECFRHHIDKVPSPNSRPMHWHQLHGHNKEMISNNEKSKDEYICYLKIIDVLWTKH